MAIYIETYQGLERDVRKHLITICQNDPGLSFELGHSHPSVPGSQFVLVRYQPTNTSVGAQIVGEASDSSRLVMDTNVGAMVPINGDVLIFPREYDDQYPDGEGGFLTVYQQPGFTFHEPDDVIGGWQTHIYCDPSPIWQGAPGANYVTKDSSGACLPAPHLVILFHELVHAARVLQLPVEEAAKVTHELNALIVENMYRLSVGLPARGDLFVSEKEIAKAAGVCP